MSALIDSRVVKVFYLLNESVSVAVEKCPQPMKYMSTQTVTTILVETMMEQIFPESIPYETMIENK